MHDILIVDDSEMFRRTVKRIIGAHLPDCLIREASNGPEAIRRIREQEPDLILMDIRLPGENGLKITEKIKTENPASKVIFVSGYDSQEYQDGATRLGADGFLSKSRTSPAEMIAAIETILNKA